MDGSLAGRTAIVTGAASGIGAAIAEAFALEGANLVLVDLDASGLSDTARRIEAAHVESRVEVVDVTDAEATRQLVKSAVDTFGTLDVLVNAAGVVRSVPFTEMTVEAWDDMISADLRSVFLCCRWAAPVMVSQGAGRIINVSSQIALKGGVDIAHYTAAKAGVIGLTKALAHELAPLGVLVNAIAPGPIETPMLASMDEEWRAAKLAELPLRRFGTPREVAPTAVLLASDPAGNLFAGQVLGPNSGDVMP